MTEQGQSPKSDKERKESEPEQRPQIDGVRMGYANAYDFLRGYFQTNYDSLTPHQRRDFRDALHDFKYCMGKTTAMETIEGGVNEFCRLVEIESPFK